MDLAAPLVRIIPNGARTALSTPRSPSSGPIRILTVANLTETKRVIDVVRALELLKASRPDIKWRWVIVGDGPARGELEQAVAAAALDSQVTFAGVLQHPAVLAEFGRSDIFCLPSAVEAFGIVFVEAMAAGVPPIGCLGTGAANSIIDGQTGLLVPRSDPEAVARALEQLLGDESRRTALAEAGRRHAQAFTWKANALKYLALISDIQTRSCR
jgi:glycosyltransferase involved in cell wall biosynthesis